MSAKHRRPDRDDGVSDRQPVDPELVGRTIVACECYVADGALWRELRLDDGTRVTMLASGPWLIELAPLPARDS